MPGIDAIPSGTAGSPRIVVVAGEGTPARRYAAWLNPTYETRITSPDGPSDHGHGVGGDVVLVDHEVLVSRGEAACRALGREDAGCQLLATVAPGVDGCPADDCVVEPVRRDDLLNAVAVAGRVATYDDTIEELLSLTARRRALRERLSPAQLEECQEFARLSARVDRLHARIDDSLVGVESRYAALLGRGRRCSATSDREDGR